MNTPLKDLTFVVFDTETTGLDPAKDRILEIAAIAFRLDGQVLGQFATLIDHGLPVPQEISDINGITAAMCAGAPSIRQAMALFSEFLSANWARDRELVGVAHNAPFDCAFLWHAVSEWG